MSNDTTDVTTSRVASFFSRNGWWYASAALMLMVVLGLVVILVLPGDDNSPDTSAPATDPVPPPLSSAAPSPSDSPTATGWDDLGCNGTKGPTEIPTTAPEATWEPVGGYSVPASDLLGPTKVTDSIRTCYQHTPAGALFAATNISMSLGSTDPATYKAVVTNQMTAGPYQAELLAEGASQDPEQRAWSFVSYGFESCSAERCNLSVVASSAGTLVQIYVRLVWVDGDWRLDGTTNPGGGGITAIPAGFTNFGPGA